MQFLALLRTVHNPCQRREMAVSTNNGLVNGPVHNLLMQFFTRDGSKMEVFETSFFDIVTTQNGHPRYVKPVLGRIYVFFTPIGYYVQGGGVLPRDWYTTCLCSFSPCRAQKSTFSKLVFFDIVTTQNDHPRYVKHVLGCIYVFFTLFGYQVRGGGGGAPKGGVHNLLMQLFNPDSSKIEVFETCFFDIVTTQNDHPRYVKDILAFCPRYFDEILQVMKLETQTKAATRARTGCGSNQ